MDKYIWTHMQGGWQHIYTLNTQKWKEKKKMYDPLKSKEDAV